MTANLEDLLARVQAATGADLELDGRIAKVAREIPPAAVFMRENVYGQESDTWYTGGYGAYVFHYPEPYTESIDAALALVERLLGGSARHPVECTLSSVGYPSRKGRHWKAAVWAGVEKDGAYHNAPTAPLAILAALITALLAQAQGTETK